MTITVLLADDHGVVRAGLRALLETQSDLLVVGEATNGRMAVSEALQRQPDVVVLDIAMPELEGIDAAYQIHTALPAIAIIILSMYATSEHVYRALKAGVRGYVLKEAAGSELIAAIRTVYAGQRHLSAKIIDEIVDNLLPAQGAPVTHSPLDQLSGREREILQLVAEGKTSSEIAQLLSLSPKTVESYRSRVMQKLALQDLPSLIKFAIRQGLITLN